MSAFGSATLGSDRNSPWAEPHLPDAKQRVVGWRNGGGITKVEQERILKDDRDAAQQYLDCKKAIAQGKLKDIQEPLAGLPPTWQAFWSTVPGLDAQAAYRAYQREEAKRQKATQVAQEAKRDEDAKAGMPKAEVQPATGESEEAVLEEISKLETQVRQKKQALVECQHRVEAWDVKLATARQADREEEVVAQRMKRTLDHASFKHGILQGKIGSSERYFSFLQTDAQATHEKKMLVLERSCALMNANIGSLKTEMRSLLKVAADQLPSHTADEASNLGTNSALEDDATSRAAPSSPMSKKRRESSPGFPLSPGDTSPIAARSPLIGDEAADVV